MERGACSPLRSDWRAGEGGPRPQNETIFRLLTRSHSSASIPVTSTATRAPSLDGSTQIHASTASPGARPEARVVSARSTGPLARTVYRRRTAPALLVAGAVLAMALMPSWRP